MKKLTSTDNANTSDLTLLVLRVGIGALMLTHGIPKLLMLFSGAPVQFPPVFGMSPEASLAATVVVEVIGSLFVLVGLGTRIAAVPLIITMAVAALLIHAPDPFAKKELAIFYLVGYIALLIGGSGKYSMDYLLSPKKRVAISATGELKEESVPAYQ